jgi:hypothetical protein
MNCHDAREQLSDFIEEALGPAELAELRSHLAGCPDCSRELEQLRATLSLLSRVERARAPVGFVDRVMAATHPVPWYRRLGGWLFLPLGRKLPAEAAAMVMIAVLGVFLLQRTPEMKDAARSEFRSPASRIEAPADKNVGAPSPQTPAPAASKPDTVESGKLAERTPRPAREAENTLRDERRRDFAQPSPPASDELKQELNKEGDADRLQKAGGVKSAPAPAAAPAQGAVAPAAPPAESRAKSRDSTEGQPATQAPAPPATPSPQSTPPQMAAKRQSAISGASGRLNVQDRPTAEKGLAELLSRVGGNETARRQEVGATVVEVLVPESRYADFIRGLVSLGAWTPEGQPTAQPTDPPQLRFSIRIAE